MINLGRPSSSKRAKHGRLWLCLSKQGAGALLKPSIGSYSIALVLGLAACAPVQVQDVGPSFVTHMGQHASDHIVLACDMVAQCLRMFPDGHLEPTPFRIPERRRLVVTDISWQGMIKSGDLQTLVLQVGVNGPDIWFGGSIGDATNGIVSKSEHLTSGIVFSVVPEPTGTGHIRSVRLYGYLVPDN
jgi:hypothetical protein